MYGLQLDKKGGYILRWPRKSSEILANALAFIRYESSLDETLQLKDIPHACIQAKYNEAVAAESAADTGETARAELSIEYRNRLTTLRANFQRILAYLQYKHAKALLLLERHGFKVRHAAWGGYTVALPRTDAGLIALLDYYLAYERSLLPADRITDPSLEEMQALQDELVTYHYVRNQARTQRAAGVSDGRLAIAELQELLQCAAHILITLRFKGKVSPELGNWGFKILIHSRRKSKSPTEVSPAEG